MARFVTFFSYTPEVWARLLDNPGDRSGPVAATIADAGGRLESIDYMFGEREGMAIFAAPDSATAAAVTLVLGSSGAFRSVASHELVSSAELVEVLRKAAAARPGYARPGAGGRSPYPLGRKGIPPTSANGYRIAAWGAELGVGRGAADRLALVERSLSGQTSRAGEP